MSDFEQTVRQHLGVDASVSVPSELSQSNARLRFLGGKAGKLPKDSVSAARTSQWLFFSGRLRRESAGSKQETFQILSLLNNELRLRPFLTGFVATLADFVVALSLTPALATLSGSDPSAIRGLTNLTRWYAHMVACTTVLKDESIPVPQLKSLEESAEAAPIALPLNVAATFGGAAAEKVVAKNAKGKGQKQQPQKQKGKKGKKQQGNQKQKKGGKQAPAAAAEPIAEIDIRVGRILKVWEHPESDKLWCEEVDCGEEKPRQILSGLRHNFKSDEMLRRVLVVCNLKAAKLGGIPSHGMVLCASNDDHTKVEFLQPPEGAVVGERVTFAGVENAKPASGSRINKKKLFIKAAEDFKTTSDCIAAHNGRHMMTTGGPVKVKSLANSSIK